MLEMNTSPRLRRVKHGYTSGARSLAGRSVTRLARTGVTPNVLTTTGVSLCLAAAILVPFENRADSLLVYWLPPPPLRGGSPRHTPRRARPPAGGAAPPLAARCPPH